VKQAFVFRVESAEAAWDKAQTALTAVAGQRETLSRRLDDTKKQVTALTAKLTELTNDGTSLQERERNLQTARYGLGCSEGAAAGDSGSTEEFDGDPQDVAQRLETQLERPIRHPVRPAIRKSREETRLEGLSVQGPYSALAVARKRLLKLEQEVAREELEG